MQHMRLGREQKKNLVMRGMLQVIVMQLSLSKSWSCQLDHCSYPPTGNQDFGGFVEKSVLCWSGTR